MSTRPLSTCRENIMSFHQPCLQETEEVLKKELSHHGEESAMSLDSMQVSVGQR